MTPPNREARNQPAIGRPVVRVSRTPSTMDLAASLAALGARSGTVVRAGSQTAGRGRAGRHWQDRPDASVLVSAIHISQREPRELGVMALLAGLATSNTVEGWLAGGATRLKWPNDVLAGDRKIAGVLVTSRPKPTGLETVLVIGIGLNVNVPAGSLPEGATSLGIELGRLVDVDAVFDRLVAELDAVVRRFECGLAGDDLATIHGRLAFRDELVTVIDAGREISGRVHGVDSAGALVLDRGGDRIRVVAGDVVRGPRPMA